MKRTLAPAQDRPFKVLGVQQIAIGGVDKTRLQTLWIDMLGLELTGNFRSERENVDEDICTIGVGPFKVEVDLMQPIDPAGKPAVHTTPLNHVGLWIDDLARAMELTSISDLNKLSLIMHRQVNPRTDGGGSTPT